MDNPFLAQLPLNPMPGTQVGDSRSLSTHSILYPFLQRLEGYKTNLKGHHWHGYNHSTHVMIDEFLGEVSEAQDSIAEVGMDVYGIMILGFEATPSKNWDILALTKDIINDFIFINKTLENDDRNLGLLDVVQAAIHELNKKRYLITLAYKGEY